MNKTSTATGSQDSAELQQKLKLLEDENQLMLLQLHQVQEELEHYYLLFQESERRADELAKRIEDSGAPSRGGEVGFFYKLTDLLGITIRGKIASVRSSGLFDEDWYLQSYPDVAKEGADAAAHYIRHGAKEGRDPGPEFDTQWYLSSNPDVAAAGMNPLVHYARHGRGEGRLPRPGGIRPTTNPVDAERRRLIRARDEQARLAAERSRKIEALNQVKAELEQEKRSLSARRDSLQEEVTTLTQARDEQAKLAAERLRQVEALNQVKAELEQEKRSLSARRDALQDEVAHLVQALDDQAKLSAEQAAKLAEVQDRLQQNESGYLERERRQQLMHEELVRAEAQIDLIKEVLLREPHYE